MRLLVVEDDKQIAAYVASGLRQDGFVVEIEMNGVDGFHRLSTEQFDAAVVDVMLPGMSGLDMIESLRSQQVMTPVLILSAKKSVDDRVRGLMAGGDDYLTKPFSFTELQARIHALIRRATAVAEPSSLQVGDLAIDLLRRRVTRAEREIELQPREFALLEYLVRNQGRVVSRTMIMEHVWGYDFDPQTNVVESRMSRLRDKVDKGFDGALIQTVRGAGYVVEDPA